MIQIIKYSLYKIFKSKTYLKIDVSIKILKKKLIVLNNYKFVLMILK